MAELACALAALRLQAAATTPPPAAARGAGGGGPWQHTPRQEVSTSGEEEEEEEAAASWAVTPEQRRRRSAAAAPRWAKTPRQVSPSSSSSEGSGSGRRGLACTQVQTSSGGEDEDEDDDETLGLPRHTQVQYSSDDAAGLLPCTQVQHTVLSSAEEDAREASEHDGARDTTHVQVPSLYPSTQVQQTASSEEEDAAEVDDVAATVVVAASAPPQHDFDREVDDGGFDDGGFDGDDDFEDEGDFGDGGFGDAEFELGDEGGFGGSDDDIVDDYADWEDDAPPRRGAENDGPPHPSPSQLSSAGEEEDDVGDGDEIQNDYADWETQDQVDADTENRPPSLPETAASPRSAKKTKNKTARAHQQRTLAFTVQRKPTASPTLHPHQVEAVEWMLAREGRGRGAGHTSSRVPVLGGGILADECGLGKTLTALTLTARARAVRHPHRGGTLVVCPAALVGQWVSEIESQTALRVLAYHSPKQRTKVHSDPFNFCRYDIVVTSYRCVGRDAVGAHVPAAQRARILQHGAAHAGGWVARSKGKEDTPIGAQKKKAVVGCSLLHCVEWERVVADEAHVMSNRATKRFKACNALPARYRWALTATPVGNSSKELGTLLQWVSQSLASGCPASLPPGNRVSARAACSSAVEAAMNLGASSACRVENVIVRRRKATTLGAVAPGRAEGAAVAAPDVHHQRLPELIERDAWLTRREGSFEEALYAALHRHTKKYTKKYVARRDGGKRAVRARDRLHVFELLTRLRQAACHPGLVLRSAATGSDKFRASIAKCVAAFDGVEMPRRGAGQEEFVPAVRGRAGAKIRALIKLVKPWAALGETFVVFSSWTSLLDICVEALERERFACAGSGSAKKRQLRLERIDGKTPISHRPAVIARCADGRSDGLLVSIKAAGAGLNMPCFQHVVLMEPSWNPSVEKQAIGRVHRLGRRDPTEDVTVHRLLVRGTIEESLVQIQARKRDDARALLDAEGEMLEQTDDDENGMGEALVSALFGS